MGWNRALVCMALLSVSTASAATLFSDPAESLTNFVQIGDSDSSADVFTYSALGIPEAPGMIAGSAPLTGIRLKANKGDSNAAPAGINLVLGSSPQAFSGSYTLQYYVWMYEPANASAAEENFLGGVARLTAKNVIDTNTAGQNGSGSYFGMDGNNNLSPDFEQYNGLSQDVALDDTQMSTQENAAFKDTLNTTDHAAANQWVKVDVVLDTTKSPKTAAVYFNDVLFSSDTSTGTGSYAWIGYEDPQKNIGSSSLAGIFDNITVIQGVPEPATATLIVFSGLAFRAMNRRCNRTRHLSDHASRS